MTQVKKSFTVACHKFFGLKENQTLQQFLKETRELTVKDMKEMKPELELELKQPIEIKDVKP